MKQSFLAAALTLLLPMVAFAQQRPLVTEDPETIGAGRVLVEAGFDYGHGVEYPASGLEGNLLRVPLVGVSVGVSSIAEIQIDGGFYNRLSITGRVPAPLSDMLTVSGDSTSDVEDLIIGMKIRVVGETTSRPAFGVRFATKLPNASNESGLGLDTTDFFASLVGAKTIRSVRVVGNIGLGILGDPTRGDRQNDVLTYGFSLARAITQPAEVVAEVNGQIDTREGAPPPGTGSRGQVRLGARYTIKSWRADAAVLVGVTSRDPSIGFTAGFTYVFNAFKVP
jgi:Putative MetA-pathway of phenol degradation